MTAHPVWLQAQYDQTGRDSHPFAGRPLRVSSNPTPGNPRSRAGD